MEAVIGTDDGESHQVELGEDQARALTGMAIGDEIDGSLLGLNGYTLRITGGSDTEGFPMRESVKGTGRKQLLLDGGTGARELEDGERKRKSVRGNTVSGQISQVNLSVVEEGEDDIETLLGEEPDEEEPASDDDTDGDDADEEEGEDDQDEAEEGEEQDEADDSEEETEDDPDGEQ